MESLCSPILLLPFLAALFWTFLRRLPIASPPEKNGGEVQKLPPGPPCLPILGNLHLLGLLPHRALNSLAKTYGPIMSIQLGRVPALVVTSPDAAEQFLKNYDATFACRPRMEAPDQMTYGGKGMIFTHYGPYYCGVKKICHSNLLSRSKVDEMKSMRKEEVAILIEKLRRAAMADQVVNLSANVTELIENMTFRMVLGKKKDERFDLREIVREVIKLTGAINIADYLPTPRFLDMQGLRKRLKRITREIENMLETIIEEHQEKSSHRSEKEKPSDFIDSLLISMINQPMNPEDRAYTIDRENVKSLALEMIAAAISTSPTVVDWTLSELLRHPRVMKLTQQELQNVVGMDRMVEETDLPKLSYLEMVVKEALRLNPIAPLLVPRESMQETTINGYFIPKKTRVFVNIWAIGRDPKVWSENVLQFYPERFLENTVNMIGRDFEFTPFGAGRRGCPGINVGLMTVKYVLAQLLHCFDWNLPAGVLPGDVDMSEKYSIPITRGKPLFAIPTNRLRCPFTFQEEL